MSYILDALKKSEQERQQAEREQQSDVNAALAYDTPEPKKSRNYGALVILILIVNVAIGAYVFLKDDTPSSGTVAKVGQQQAKPKPLPKPKPISKPIKQLAKDKNQIAKIDQKKNAPKANKPKTILRSDSNKRIAQKHLAKAQEKSKQVVQIDPNAGVKQIDVNKVQPQKNAVNQPKQIASVDTNQQTQTVKRSGKLPVPTKIDTRSVKQQRKVAKPKGLTRTRVGVEQTNKRVIAAKSQPQIQQKPQTNLQSKPQPKPQPKPKTSPKVVFSKVELTADPNDVPDQSGSVQQRTIKPKIVRRARVPNFMDMDPDFRRTFPKIDINVHVYADDPNDRFALIEMKRYGEGDTLSGGIKIKEIAPEGFVIVYKGKTFLYPAK